MRPDYSKLGDLRDVDAIVPGLFQGRRPNSYVGYDLVVSCEQHLAKKPMADYLGLTLHLAMVDDDAFVIPDQAVVYAARLVANVVRDGGQALVHCSGGLNRSSLVTVRALQALGYGSPHECLAILRRTRDDFCLCNRAFERWALGEALPTAETSAFRTEAA